MMGMSLNEALNVCKSISEYTTEYYFDDIYKNSFIYLRDAKLELVFDGATQMLVGITGTFSPEVRLSGVESLDLRRALEILPATKKGNFHENFYTLVWPEIHISFKLDEVKARQLKELPDHPLTADYAPKAERFWFSGAAPAQGLAVTAGLGGITLPSGRRLLVKEHSAQDVVTEIGEPDFQEGRFFKYAKLGLMLEISDRIENIFLFANLPTHPDSFGVHERCPWTLEISGKEKLDFRTPWKMVEAALGHCESPVVLPGVQVYSYPLLGLQFEVSAGHVAVLHITSSFWCVFRYFTFGFDSYTFM